MLYVVTVKNSNEILQEFKASEYDLPALVTKVAKSDELTLVSVRFDE